jgi:hypothetical protein
MMFLRRVKGLGMRICNTFLCSYFVLSLFYRISNDNSYELFEQLVDKSHLAGSWTRVVNLD